MFIPAPGTMLTVDLPGERLRAQVTSVYDQDTVFVVIGQPLTKNHTYRKDDLITCLRTQTDLGEIWEAMDERVLWARTQEAKEPELPVRKKRVRKAVNA